MQLTRAFDLLFESLILIFKTKYKHSVLNKHLHMHYAGWLADWLIGWKQLFSRFLCFSLLFFVFRVKKNFSAFLTIQITIDIQFDWN